jgi:hypothetical protein
MTREVEVEVEVELELDEDCDAVLCNQDICGGNEAIERNEDPDQEDIWQRQLEAQWQAEFEGTSIFGSECDEVDEIGW